MMKIKLHLKLTFIFCFSLILGLGVGYLHLSSQLKNDAEENLQNSLYRQIQLTRDLLEATFHQPNSFKKANQLAQQISQQQDLRVTILDKNGKVIGESDVDPADLENLENHIDRPEIQQAAQEGFGTSTRYSTTLKGYLLYAAIPFGRDASVSGFLRYAVPLSYIEKLQAQIKKTIGLTIGFIFLLSLVFAHLLSLFVSKPLSEVAQVARAMAQGDFSQKPFVFSDDEIGDLAKTLSFMSDEIKNKIEQIDQDDVKLDTVLSSMIEGVMVIDSEGKILLMNPSLRKIFFVDSNPEAKIPIEAIRNTKVQDIVNQALTGQQKLISHEISLDPSSEKILQVNATTIIRNELIEGVVLVFHDISELRRLEKMRQDFVANVSHELRTPISSIKGYAETLLEGALNNKKDTKDFIAIIYEDANRLASLIDDLLDLAKIESGKMKMLFIPLDIAPIIETCLGILEKTIKKKEIAVSLHLAKPIPKILADDQRLTQVLLNLLDNAVKYSPKNGFVSISAFESGDFVQIDIQDNGVGIPSEDLLRIFERFYRVDKARSRELGGTGLGLAIVKNIIIAHGGQVWARSEPDQGSIFSFTLPKA